ncbi:pleckstrin homology domain-containing family G member 5 [Brachionus plicatilis]|uniref:Pleckstrin homology domain-containing family G member 5 n=1 Tax=Brachionus plicatilis TaxID=10195 RepID=A0A3M7PI33_BRAPC|nr:pleckstrin homology domain-containing family G member 5 [Brachionus plicatilis]
MDINSDDYELCLNDQTQVDLDQMCEQFFGTEFILKKKELTPKHEEEVPKQNITAQPTSSSINWHNYFSSKAYKNSKHKRNSCIAVMNEHSSSQTQAGSLKNSSSSSICSNYSNMAYPSPVNASERVVRVNRGNFRRMGQIASIFASYSNSKLIEAASPLNHFLELYTRQLPKLPEEFAIGKFDPAWLEIEPDWNKFVGDSYAQSLPIRKAKQQMAIWELLVTECSFIKSTKIVIDVFLNCLVNLKLNEQTSELFKDIDLKKLFCNIIEVFKCNLTLWCKYLHPTLHNLVNGSSISLLIDPQFLISSFSDFKNLFQPYEEYCLVQNNLNDYLKQKAAENEHFAKFITVRLDQKNIQLDKIYNL